MLQLEMIERVKHLAQNHPAVSALLMYGSFVKDEGDVFSDIEFYVFLKPCIEFNHYDWISEIDDVSVLFINEFGTEVAIFKTLIRGEFHFLPVRKIDVVTSWKGLISFEYHERMNLVDKEGELSAILGPISKDRPNRETKDSIHWISCALVNGLLFTRNLLLRKELAHAHQSFYYLHKYILWMIRIQVKSTGHWESPTKNAEQDIPLKWYEKYVACVPALNVLQLTLSFDSSIQLCKELFEDLGVSNNLKKILKEIEATSTPIIRSDR